MPIACGTAQIDVMNAHGTSAGSWKSVRLELANCPDFPQGSASRAYILCLPLSDDGEIDEAVLNGRPLTATVRRFWPSEPDMSGYVAHEDRGWRFLYTRGVQAGSRTACMDFQPFRLSELVTLTELDGSRLPFRVTRVWAAAAIPSAVSDPGSESDAQDLRQA